MARGPCPHRLSPCPDSHLRVASLTFLPITLINNNIDHLYGSIPPLGPRLRARWNPPQTPRRIPGRTRSHQLSQLQHSRDGPGVARVQDSVPGGPGGAGGGGDDVVGHADGEPGGKQLVWTE